MRVLITGATGLIGKELVKQCLKQQIDVHYLTTSKSKLEDTENYKGFYWNPRLGEINSDAIQGVDAIIHLAGATIAKRWTSDYKTEILESRVLTGNLLFNTLQKNEHVIKHFISSSGVNVYPSDYNELYTEDFKGVDDSFLGNVVVSWEEVADKFNHLNIKVSKIRTGMVLDSKEGALPQIIKPIKFGVGAALGSGNQWQSWIHLQDIAKIYLHVLTSKLEGTFNAVAPEPVTNSEMTKVLAKHLKKPLILPNVPEFALKLILGEMATLLTSSQNVSSQKIEKTGFKFDYPNLKEAVKDLL